MKFSQAILIGILTLLTFSSNAQNESQECRHLRALANEAFDKENNKIAVSYFLELETTCGLDIEYYYRLIGSIIPIINAEPQDSKVREQYIDTILGVWERMELAGAYREHDDFLRATYVMQSAQPDYEKADFLFQRGIKDEGPNTHESYIVYAYYATYVIYDSAKGERKAQFKRRMLSDYMTYTDLVDSAKASDQTKENLNYYFEYVFPSCEELLGEVNPFIQTLPEEKETAIDQIQHMIQLIEGEHCTEGKEYLNLVDEWLKLDSNSFEAIYRHCFGTNKRNPLSCLPLLMEATDDPLLKAKIQYQIAYSEYKVGQYMAAHASGLACTGEYQSKGLLIAAQSVAALASTCGDTTFDRKCNYIYAAQLAEEAGMDEAAGIYRSKGPTTNCTTDLIPVTLSCWEVTVKVCR